MSISLRINNTATVLNTDQKELILYNVTSKIRFHGEFSIEGHEDVRAWFLPILRKQYQEFRFVTSVTNGYKLLVTVTLMSLALTLTNFCLITIGCHVTLSPAHDTGFSGHTCFIDDKHSCLVLFYQ